MDTTTDLEHGHVQPAMPEDAGPVASRRGSWLGLGVALGVVVLDQVVKWYVEQVLEPGEFVPWLSDHIGWQLVYNDGGAFGLPMPSWFFLVVTTVVVVLVVRNLPRVLRVLPTVSYGLLLAGALGNVIDRLVRSGDPGDPRFLHGHVVDFVAWGTFPRFNVADSAITIGFVLLAWDLWRHGDEDTRMPGTGVVGPDTTDPGRPDARTGLTDAGVPGSDVSEDGPVHGDADDRDDPPDTPPASRPTLPPTRS